MRYKRYTYNYFFFLKIILDFLNTLCWKAPPDIIWCNALLKAGPTPKSGPTSHLSHAAVGATPSCAMARDGAAQPACTPSQPLTTLAVTASTCLEFFLLQFVFILTKTTHTWASG